MLLIGTADVHVEDISIKFKEKIMEPKGGEKKHFNVKKLNICLYVITYQMFDWDCGYWPIKIHGSIQSGRNSQ